MNCSPRRCAPSPTWRGHLDPLTGWLEDADETRETALSGVFAALADLDLMACAEASGVGGDLLGPVYSVMRSASEKAGHGAYYTPATLCRLMADLVPAENFARVNEPACGSAAMVLAQARAMRARGRFPETVEWVLQDIDPWAVALAGVNVSSHGLPLVRLECVNVLTAGV